MAQTPSRGSIEEVILRVKTRGLTVANKEMDKFIENTETAELAVSLLNEELKETPVAVSEAARQMGNFGNNGEVLERLEAMSEVLTDEFGNMATGIDQTNTSLVAMRNSLGAMEQYSDATREATENTEGLTREQIQASRAHRDSEQAAVRTTRAVEGLGRAHSSTGRHMSAMAAQSNALVQTYAKIAANLFALMAAVRLIQSGDQINKMTRALEGISTQTGNDLFLIAEGMVAVSKGAIDLRTAMESSAQAGIFGFTASEMKRMTMIAMGASDAMGLTLPDAMARLTKGIALVQPELLNNLGIMIRADDAYAAYARTLKKTATELSIFERQQAITFAVLESTGAQFLAEQGKQGLSNIEATVGNVTTGIQRSLSWLAGHIDDFLGSPEWKAFVHGTRDTLLGIAEFKGFELVTPKHVKITEDVAAGMARIAKIRKEYDKDGNQTVEYSLALSRAQLSVAERLSDASLDDIERSDKATELLEKRTQLHSKEFDLRSRLLDAEAAAGKIDPVATPNAAALSDTIIAGYKAQIEEVVNVLIPLNAELGSVDNATVEFYNTLQITTNGNKHFEAAATQAARALKDFSAGAVAAYTAPVTDLQKLTKEVYANNQAHQEMVKHNYDVAAAQDFQTRMMKNMHDLGMVPQVATLKELSILMQDLTEKEHEMSLQSIRRSSLDINTASDRKFIADAELKALEARLNASVNLTGADSRQTQELLAQVVAQTTINERVFERERAQERIKVIQGEISRLLTDDELTVAGQYEQREKHIQKLIEQQDQLAGNPAAAEQLEGYKLEEESLKRINEALDARFAILGGVSNSTTGFAQQLGLDSLLGEIGGSEAEKQQAALDRFQDSLNNMSEFAPGVEQLGTSFIKMGISLKAAAEAGEGWKAQMGAIGPVLGSMSGAVQGLAAMEAQLSENRVKHMKKNGATDKQIEAEQRKSFEKQKKMRKAGVILDTAAAVISSISSLGVPWGLPGAAIATAMGAMSLATINATTFEGGGDSVGSPASLTAGGEAGATEFDVANQKDSDFGDFLGTSPPDLSSSLSSSGGSPRGGGSTVVINAMDAASFSEFAINNRETFQRAVDESLQETEGRTL